MTALSQGQPLSLPHSLGRNPTLTPSGTEPVSVVVVSNPISAGFSPRPRGLTLLVSAVDGTWADGEIRPFFKRS